MLSAIDLFDTLMFNLIRLKYAKWGIKPELLIFSFIGNSLKKLTFEGRNKN